MKFVISYGSEYGLPTGYHLQALTASRCTFGIKLTTTQLLSSDWKSFERNGVRYF